MSGKKRLFLAAGTLASVGAVVALAVGVTFGLFSASQNSTPSTFATGTVSIGNPAVDTNCTVTKMVPGDQSPSYSPANPNFTNSGNADLATCEFQVTYTGSVPAYIGLKTTLGAGTLGSALQWEISESTGATPSNTQPGAFASGGLINTNSAANPLYVATDSGSGNTYTFYVDYLLPDTVTSQTLTAASLGLTVEAVQAGNNGDGVCTVGQQCLGSGHINSWS